MNDTQVTPEERQALLTKTRQEWIDEYVKKEMDNFTHNFHDGEIYEVLYNIAEGSPEEDAIESMAIIMQSVRLLPDTSSIEEQNMYYATIGRMFTGMVFEYHRGNLINEAEGKCPLELE